jgi:hypothetical protein
MKQNKQDIFEQNRAKVHIYGKMLDRDAWYLVGQEPLFYQTKGV